MSLTTTGTEITEGKHYWEVELLSEDMVGIVVGISKPNLDPTGRYYSNTNGLFVSAYSKGGKQRWAEALSPTQHTTYTIHS
jgi:hypothetical protein